LAGIAMGVFASLIDPNDPSLHLSRVGRNPILLKFIGAL
jgi:hypothetical protein